jgi:hypothetical protein
MELSKAYKTVLQSPEIKKAISKQEGITEEAVRRWIRNNSKNLTRASVLRLVRDETGLDEEQLLDDAAKVETIVD